MQLCSLKCLSSHRNIIFSDRAREHEQGLISLLDSSEVYIFRQKCTLTRVNDVTTPLKFSNDRLETEPCHLQAEVQEGEARSLGHNCQPDSRLWGSMCWPTPAQSFRCHNILGIKVNKVSSVNKSCSIAAIPASCQSFSCNGVEAASWILITLITFNECSYLYSCFH